MNKKIIALALAIVLIATLFAGCTKYGDKVEINGKDYIVMTDDEGNTIIDEDNNMIVVVTNANGKEVVDQNGEPQTYLVQVLGDELGNGKVYSKYGTFITPEGWEGNTKGFLVKKGTNEKCYINCTMVAEIDKENTYEKYIENAEQQIATIVLAAEQQGAKANIDKGGAVITKAEIATKKFTSEIYDSKGDLGLYSEVFYFTHEEKIYKLEYVCYDGAGYDESFNVEEYLYENFTFIVPANNATANNAE